MLMKANYNLMITFWIAYFESSQEIQSNDILFVKNERV